MRDAPALNLIEQLNRLGAKVKAYDPIICQTGAAHGLSGVSVESDAFILADGCDALVVVTEWEEFRNLNYKKLSEKMTTKVIIDGRNFLDAEVLAASGFYYVGIGRPTPSDTSVSVTNAKSLVMSL